MFTTKFDSITNPTNWSLENQDKNNIAKNSNIDSIEDV